MAEEWLTCPACGYENRPGSQYCAECARRLSSQTVADIELKRSAALAGQRTEMRWVMVFLASAVVVIVVVIVVALLVIR